MRPVRGDTFARIVAGEGAITGEFRVLVKSANTID